MRIHACHNFFATVVVAFHHSLYPYFDGRDDFNNVVDHFVETTLVENGRFDKNMFGAAALSPEVDVFSYARMDDGVESGEFCRIGKGYGR